MIILLDTGPLGLVTNPLGNPESVGHLSRFTDADLWQNIHPPTP